MRLSGHLGFMIVLVALALATAGCSKNAAADRDAAARSKAKTPVAVRTVAVVQQDVRQTTVQPATVHPFYTASIQSRVDGYVKEVKADIGDVVAAGDPLAVIDVPDLAARRLKAVAQLEQQHAEEDRAAAGIALATAGVASAEARAAEARSGMRQVDASLAAAEAEFRRTEDLVNRGSMQQRVLDEVRQRRDSEAASKEAVTAAIQSAVASVDVAKSTLASAGADARAAAARTRVQEAEIVEIDEFIGLATLTAPFAGVITARSVSPGDLVSPDGRNPPLFVVSQLDRVRIHIPVPEDDAAWVDQGDSISLRFPSFPAEEAMTVAVTRLTGSLDPSTRTMLVEAEVINTDGKLLPGFFGQATLTLSTQVASRMLPARAVRFEESGSAYVYVVTNSKVSVVPVTTGMDDGNSIEIVSGLDSGQTVIGAHLQRFTDGQEVRVLE